MPRDVPDWTKTSNPTPTLLATIPLVAATPINQVVQVPSTIMAIDIVCMQSLKGMRAVGNNSGITIAFDDVGDFEVAGPFYGPSDTAFTLTYTPTSNGTLWVIGFPMRTYPTVGNSLGAELVELETQGAHPPPGTRYDVTGVSAPAVGTSASVVLAGVVGKSYTLSYAKTSLTPTTAAVQRIGYVFLDGASTVGTDIMAVPATIDSQQSRQEAGLAIPGSGGNPFTVQQTGMAAGGQGSVSVGAYLR